ncbi:MAG: LysR family transcriptional regulator [Pseudomonadota bacterium]
MLINYDHLRTLLEIGASATFAQAAAKLTLTPSAVSHQVRALEAQLGFAVFERVGRASRLTPEGQQLLDVVREHFPPIEEALAGIRDDQRTVQGSVSLAGPMPFARIWLRPRVVRLMRAYPALALNVRFGVPSALTLGLLDGSLDFAILAEAPDSPLLAFERLFVETFIAVCAPAYWAGAPPARTVKQLSEQRFIVFSDALAMHAAWWRATFGKAPLPHNVVCRIANVDEMLYLAEQGLGIAVLPNYVVTESLAAGRLVPVRAKPARSRQLGAPQNPLLLAWRKARAETARLRVVRSALLAPSESLLG